MQTGSSSGSESGPGGEAGPSGRKVTLPKDGPNGAMGEAGKQHCDNAGDWSQKGDRVVCPRAPLLNPGTGVEIPLAPPPPQAQDQLQLLEQQSRRLGLLEEQSRRAKAAGGSEHVAAGQRYVTAVKAAERELMQLR